MRWVLAQEQRYCYGGAGTLSSESILVYVENRHIHFFYQNPFTGHNTEGLQQQPCL